MRGDELPLAMRIVHVARDASLQRMLGGAAHAASVVRGRSGHAFDPEVVAAFADEEAGFLAIDTASAWEETRGRARCWQAARSKRPWPLWATLLISSRRASSDTPQALRGWL